MARFRATIQGNRGMASRLGHKCLDASINGWNLGVKVYAYVNEKGKDEFKVFQTGGSNAHCSDVLIATLNRM